MSVAIPIQSEWLTVESLNQRPNVDRENKIIRGVVIAEAGKMKDGRGYFSERSLQTGIQLANQKEKGIKSRLQHPGLSDDGAAKFLGRQNNNRLENGKWLADMHLDASSFVSPAGNLGDYVMKRAESDAASFGTSLVGKFDYFNAEGESMTRNEMYEAQEENPGSTHWIPTEIHSSDVVDSPNATSSFLSAEHLPDKEVRQATESLNSLFANQSRDVVESRCMAFLNRYLDHRYGVREMSLEKPTKTETPAPNAEKEIEVLEKNDPVQEVLNDAEPVGPTAKELAQQAADRAAEISQLCLIAKCPEKAGVLIANLQLSANDVREHLAAKMALDNSLSTDIPNDASETHEPTQDEKDEADWKKNQAHYERHGINLERFKVSAKVDRNNGFVEPTSAVVLQ